MGYVLVEIFVVGGYVFDVFYGFYVFYYFVEYCVVLIVWGVGLVQEVVIGYVDEELGIGGVWV